MKDGTPIFEAETLEGKKLRGSLLLMNDRAYIYPESWGDLGDIDFSGAFKEVKPDTIRELGKEKPKKPFKGETWCDFLYRLPLQGEEKDALADLVNEAIDDEANQAEAQAWEECRDKFGV